MLQLFVLLFSSFTLNFYSLQFRDSDGIMHTMSEYQGKKILIVNIATGSTAANQLQKLQQLQDQYADSLIVIGFPSNSFMHEEKTNQQLKQFCATKYGVHFLLAQKNDVKGATVQAVYNWLSSESQNGVMNSPVLNDFQKYLISESGQLIGVFSPSTDPLSVDITSALHN